MKVNGLFHSLFFKNEIFHSGKTLNQTIHAFRWVRGNAGARGEWREGEASGAHLGGAEVERRLHAGRRLWQGGPPGPPGFWDDLEKAGKPGGRRPLLSPRFPPRPFQPAFL